MIQSTTCSTEEQKGEQMTLEEFIVLGCFILSGVCLLFIYRIVWFIEYLQTRKSETVSSRGPYQVSSPDGRVLTGMSRKAAGNYQREFRGRIIRDPALPQK